MSQIGSIICEIAFWLGGIVFIHREEKRSNFSIRMIISTVIALVVCLMLGVYYGGDFPFEKVVVQGMTSIGLICYFLWKWKPRRR